jgi:hypothetical protein
MTGLVRKAAVFAVVGLLVSAGAAFAGIPSAANSTIPAFIDVVGQAGGVPDALGAYTVTIRDAGNNPLPNATVGLDFSGCTDIKICDDVGQNTTVVCSVVTGITDALGQFTFIVCGGAINDLGNEPGAGLGCVAVTADGISMGSITATACDENGADPSGTAGCDITDLSSWLADWGSGSYYGRSDFDHDTALLITDLSFWLTLWGTGGSASGCNYCP